MEFDDDTQDYNLPFTNRAQTERLRFIDFMLDNTGIFKRRFLMDYFGLSQPQATLDLRLYRKLAPENLRQDLSTRCYRSTPEFKRKFP